MAGADLEWGLLEDGSLDGPTNMARDHALALGLEAGCGVVRIYGWDPPTVSFGRNEPVRDLYDRQAAGARGWGLVRRPTGGRAVLHHREVTYSVVLPMRALGGPRATYRAINGALVRGLALLGVEAEIAKDPPGGAAPPSAGPCFHLPAGGEVVVGGRKLVGSAQVRIGRTVLQHGSLLVHDDQGRLDEIRMQPAVGDAPATLSDLLGRTPSIEEVTESLAAGFRVSWPGPWRQVRSGSLEGVRELLAHYRSEEWTWRR